MRGIETFCYICGIPGETYGSPSWWDRCVDGKACADRVLAKKKRADKRIKELEEEVKQLKEKVSP